MYPSIGEISGWSWVPKTQKVKNGLKVGKICRLNKKLWNLVSGKFWILLFAMEIRIVNDSKQAKSYPESIFDNILTIPEGNF